MLFRPVILPVCLTLCLCLARRTMAADLLTPAADAPQYQLSNLRTEPVNIRWDEYGAKFDGSMNRGELIIATSLVSSLGKHSASRFPETVPNWASESAKKTPPAVPTAKAPKPYPVSIAIPSDSELVPKDLKLKPGVPLQACYASKWCPITTLDENDDGTLQVRWDDYGSAFETEQSRPRLSTFES